MKFIIATCIFAACVGLTLGVRCYVGSGTSVTTTMDCGTSSNKCVKSSINDVHFKTCFSQLASANSSIPAGFTLPDESCQNARVDDVNYMFCICSGDLCNGSMKTSISTILALLVSAVAGYLMM